MTEVRTRGDGGLGLIELVVAVFMLALLSLALLPSLLNGMKQSSKNATTSTASQVVRTELELAEGHTTCATMDTYRNHTGTDALTVLTDPRGVVLTASRIVGACPASTGYPGTISVTVTVRRGDNGAVVATGQTLVYVSKAS